MSSLTQLGCDCLRILLFRNETSELLVQETEHGSVLPSLQIPSHSRVAEQVTSAIENLWGLSAYCLFELAGHYGSQRAIRHQVAEAARITPGVPKGMRWAPLTSSTDRKFQDDMDVEAIRAALEAFESYRSDRLHGPFGKPGWLSVVVDWVASQTAGELKLTGNFRQFNASPTFSLIRLETNGPALWFKAVGEPNRHEYEITLELAKRLPRYLPRLIAPRAAWNAWLTVEVAGAHLSQTSVASDWQNAATTLADLQIDSFGSPLHLIESGCKDVRASSLLKRVDPFFSCVAPLMLAQTKQKPAPLTECELTTLADDVRKAIEELLKTNVPNVLGHLDWNPGNIVVSGKRTVFLDWSEGCVGHPFFTFQYLLEYWRKFHGRGHREEEAVVSAYANRWNCFLSPRCVAADLPYIPLLAAFAYAASGSALLRAAVDPEAATFLRSITRRMKREADALQQEKLTCTR